MIAPPVAKAQANNASNQKMPPAQRHAPATSIGNQAALRRAGNGPEPIAFPHYQRISRSLAITAPLASVHDPENCAARGLPAFTDGNTAHFASTTPSLHVAAHEAAHLLQHAGRTNDAGLGAERHAGMVADMVQAGAPASALLTRTGNKVPHAMRGYRWTNPAGEWKNVQGGSVSGRLSETGEMLTFSSHSAFATPDLINKAGGILKGKQSGIDIKPGSTAKTVEAPDGSGNKQLQNLDVTLSADPSGATFYSDCRQAAREVMGPQSANIPEAAMVSPGGVNTMLSGNPESLVAKTIYVDQQCQNNPNFAAMPLAEKQKFIQQAQSDFDGLSDDEKAKLKASPVAQETAKRLGIDANAKPEVGEAFAVFPKDTAGLGNYIFHYATVIMVSGSDRVTLENEGGSKDEKTASWKMEMYGPEGNGLTFHDEEKAFGADRHTLRVGTLPTPPPNAGKYSTMKTGELIAAYKNSSDANEQTYIKLELKGRNYTAIVGVEEKGSLVGDDDVTVSFGDWLGIGATDIPKGQSRSFSMPVLTVWPTPNPLNIHVYSDSLRPLTGPIGTFAWNEPYDDTKDIKLAAASARYNLEVTFTPR